MNGFLITHQNKNKIKTYKRHNTKTGKAKNKNKRGCPQKDRGVLGERRQCVFFDTNVRIIKGLGFSEGVFEVLLLFFF